MPRLRFADDLQIRYLGPLPILLPFLQRIGLQQTIDRLVPTTRRAQVTHGQVLAALVLNRLLAPRALYTLSEWTHATPIPEILGIDPAQLNDDRILRALDALFPHLEALQGSLTWRVLERFELQTSVIHWDLTSFFFEGSYPEEAQDPAAPLVRYGRPKERDAGKLRKQLQVGLATTEDGGVPFWYRSFSGNAAEVSQVGDVMESLKRVVRHSSFTLVGDSKLISHDNLLKACREGIFFLGPESRSETFHNEYLHRKAAGHRLELLSYGRDRKPRPHLYMAFETSFSLTDPKTGKVYPLRRIFVVSSEERRAARKNRRRKLTKLYEAIDKVRRNLGRYKLTTPDAVRDRVKTLLAQAKLEGAFDWSVEGEGRAMRLHFTPDGAAFRRLRQLDGVYTLVTNLSPECTPDLLLERYKRQYLSERRFADLKGPLQVRPVFLKKNRRIASLAFVLYVALLLYCLLERAARTHLAATGTVLPDPYTRRPLKQPTARRMMLAFEFYAVQRCERGEEVEYVVPRPTPLQRQIFEALGIDRPLHFLEVSSPGAQL